MWLRTYSLARAYMLTAFFKALAESRYFSSIVWSSAVAMKYPAALRGFTWSTSLYNRHRDTIISTANCCRCHVLCGIFVSRITVVFINILSGLCQHLSSSVTISTLMIHRTGLGHTQFTLDTIMSQSLYLAFSRNSAACSRAFIS